MAVTEYGFSGPLRISIDQELLLKVTSGEARMANAVRIQRRKDNGRWVKVLSGPIVAIGSDDSPSRAALLRAVATMIDHFDA